MKSLLWVSGTVLWLVSMLIYIPFEGAPKVATREFAWIVQAVGLVLITASFLYDPRSKIVRSTKNDRTRAG